MQMRARNHLTQVVELMMFWLDTPKWQAICFCSACQAPITKQCHTACTGKALGNATSQPGPWEHMHYMKHLA